MSTADRFWVAFNILFSALNLSSLVDGGGRWNAFTGIFCGLAAIVLTISGSAEANNDRR